MASTRLKTTKDGRRYYEIRVRMGRNEAELTSRWYVPEGWSQKSVDRELPKVAAEFERKCKAGEVKTREQIRIEQEQAAREAALVPTFKYYYENVFFPDKVKGRKKNTQMIYERHLEWFIYGAIGEMKMPEITDVQLTPILTALRDRGLKVNSRLKTYSVLNAIFTYAYRKGHIDKNPMDRVDRPEPTEEEGRDSGVKAFDEKEAAYILKCADKEPLHWKTLIYLLLHSGCRVGEAIGLTWECVDFSKSMITVKQTLCYNSKDGVYLNKPKNGKSRTIPLPSYVMKLLAEMKKKSADILSMSGEKLSNDYVFTAAGSDKVMHPYSPTVYFKSLEKKYGIDDFHPHKLRHTFASISLKNGADIVSVSAILGDKPETVMRTYLHDYEDGKRNTSDLFANSIAVNQ